MPIKLYTIDLDNTIIGTTELEKADAPMGCVFGRINFITISSGYDFFKAYCKTNKIELITDNPTDKLIATPSLPLVVRNELGIEIKGAGNQISGMDSDEFEILIEGIPYPFYAAEFPHHVKE